MRRDNRGFTLIELLIAISVLSVMSGVLLHSFAVSRHFNAKARTDEVVTDAAERTMEAIKGISLTDLDAELQNKLTGKTSGSIELNGITYTCVETAETTESPLSDDDPDENESAAELLSGSTKYVLTSDPQYLGGTRGNGNYIIETEIRWSPYGDLNTIRTPRIADVNIPQNIVLDNETLLSKEIAWWVEFDLLNKQLIVYDDKGDENDSNCYDSSEVHRFLCLTCSETSNTVNGKTTTTLTIKPKLVYILPPATGESIWDGSTMNQTWKSDNIKKTYSLGTFSRSFETTADKPDPELPRIYLFLPHYSGGYSSLLDGIYIDFNNELTNRYECYLIPENASDAIPINGDSSKMATNQLLNRSAGADNEDKGLNIYTFSKSDTDDRLDIAADDAKKRIFEINVSVYEEKNYPETTVLELHSTKRE
jgi:prepilin-type N-terminal cleavage/methylation domain-containing protein